MNHYRSLAAYINGHPWSILPSRMATMVQAIQLGLEKDEESSREETRKEIKALIGEDSTARQGSTQSIAILPVWGTISHRGGFFSLFFGGTSTEAFTKVFRYVIANPEVRAILLDIDSPGGTISGVPELWSEIYSARGKKPIIAIANSLASSAAYWIASAADEIVVTPSGDVGSIGVFGIHIDESKLLEDRGIKITAKFAGKYKVEGAPWAPLTEEAGEYMQKRVDEAYGWFVRDVAKGRGVSVKDVRGEEFGQGRLISAKQAVDAGLADRMATFDETLSRLIGKKKVATVNAEAEGTITASTEEKVTEEQELVEPLVAPKVPPREEPKHKPGSLVVQTLIFPKDKWSSLAEVKKWAKENNYRTDGADETKESWRLRQRNPGDFQIGSFKTFCVNPSSKTPMDECRVKAVGGRLKARAEKDDEELSATKAEIERQRYRLMFK